MKQHPPTAGRAQVRRAVHEGSYARLADMPRLRQTEFAVLGRSNVGKSALLNHVFADSHLQRVSKEPGRTRMAHFLRSDDGPVWVDLPGYGYAAAGGSEKQAWATLIADYCSERRNLKGIVWLLDIRHPGMKADAEARTWFDGLGIPVFAVLTKGDKLSGSGRRRMAGEHRRWLGAGSDPLVFSIFGEKSRKEFWERFDEWRQSNGIE